MQVVAQTIKSCLDELPGFPRTQIGFATFDSTIHFYNMKVCSTISITIDSISPFSCKLAKIYSDYSVCYAFAVIFDPATDVGGVRSG